NLIANNDFVANNGDIFLYKNCFEYAHDPARATRPRVQHSHHNIIVNNRLSAATAVWVASRQSENQWSRDCGDPLVYELPGVARYYSDDAEDNRIINNDFFVGTSIRVEDDGTDIELNRFQSPNGTGSGIYVGSAVRQVLGTPVKDTQITGNTAGSEPVNVHW